MSGVILAGGSSRRMGREKGLIPMDGEPLISLVVRQLRPHVDEVLISTDELARYAFLKLPVVPDREPDQGPLCALASSFERAAYSRLLVVSCDVPELPPTLLEALLAATNDPKTDAALIRTPDGRQPLLACYRRSAQQAIEAALGAGKRRADAALDALCVEEIPWVDPPWNLNTPEDLEAYLAHRLATSR
ncbi:MAG: molybdenum cofactor guanylyltransferase [Deltaproteobacteria bacterium]|nr:molybdenum cofactor guanylyltransferase [Deltaproteobacteria bacterium]